MTRWLRRARGALLMGLTWAMLWAPVGVLVGMLVDPDGSMDEPWLIVGALPGFLGGVAFALVLGIVGRRRRFDELSVRRFAAWGAGAGLLVGATWTAVAASSDAPRWVFLALVVVVLTLLSAVSAAASLALARMAGRPQVPDGDDDVPSGGEAQPSLGAGSDLAAPARSADAERAARPVDR